MFRHLYALSLFCLAFCLPVQAQTVTYSSESLFENHQQRLFQIRVIDIQTGSRSSSGSGFIAGNPQTLATNYHVISSAISEPEKYKLIAVSHDSRELDLSIAAIDIVNDLALLHSGTPLGEPITFSNQKPAKGAIVYAMGNPMDLGSTLVQGTYNGLAETTFYKRLHFSGSINPGMSGGPAFNQQGELIGINVSSAGDQLSFLVPVEKLSVLLTQPTSNADSADFMAQSQAQLKTSQQYLIEEINAKNWPTDQLGEAQIIGELPGLVKCWGHTTDRDPKKSLVQQFNKGCSLQDNIYINSYTTTGSLHYQFMWIDGDTLSERKLFHFLQSNKMNWSPDNRADRDDISTLKCDESLIDTGNATETTKAFYCARRYLDFPDLYDVLYVQIRKRGHKALVSHFTLAGVTPESANQFKLGFIRNVTWP